MAKKKKSKPNSLVRLSGKGRGVHRFVGAYTNELSGTGSSDKLIPKSSRHHVRVIRFVSTLESTATAAKILVAPANSPVVYEFDLSTTNLTFNGTSEVDTTLSNASSLREYRVMGKTLTYANTTQHDSRSGSFVGGICQKLPPLQLWTRSLLMEAISSHQGEMEFVSPGTYIVPGAREAWAPVNSGMDGAAPFGSGVMKITQYTLVNDDVRTGVASGGSIWNDQTNTLNVLYQSWNDVNAAPDTAGSTSDFDWMWGRCQLDVTYNMYIGDTTAGNQHIVYVGVAYLKNDASVGELLIACSSHASPGDASTVVHLDGSVSLDLRAHLIMAGDNFAPIIGWRLVLTNVASTADIALSLQTQIGLTSTNVVNSKIQFPDANVANSGAHVMFIDSNDTFNIRMVGKAETQLTESAAQFAADPADQMSTNATNDLYDALEAGLRHEPGAVSVGGLDPGALATYLHAPTPLVPVPGINPVGAFSLGDIGNFIKKGIKKATSVAGKVVRVGAALSPFLAASLTRLKYSCELEEFSPMSCSSLPGSSELKTRRLPLEEKAISAFVCFAGGRVALPDGIYRLDHKICHAGKVYEYGKVTAGVASLHLPAISADNNFVYGVGVKGDDPSPIEVADEANEGIVYNICGDEVNVSVVSLVDSGEGFMRFEDVPIPTSFERIVQTLNTLYRANPAPFHPVSGVVIYLNRGVLLDQQSDSLMASVFVLFTGGSTTRAVTGTTGFRPGRDQVGWPLPSLAVGRLGSKSTIKAQGISGLIAVSQAEKIPRTRFVQTYSDLYAETHAGQLPPQ